MCSDSFVSFSNLQTCVHVMLSVLLSILCLAAESFLSVIDVKLIVYTCVNSMRDSWDDTLVVHHAANEIWIYNMDA